MREQFDQIIGTPPPSTLDTHLIERRVRRVRDARRGGITATAVVGLGLAGVLLLGSNPPVGTPPVAQSPAQTVPTPGTPTPISSSPDYRLELKADTKANGDATAAQLAALIEKEVAAVVPGATWVRKLNIQFAGADSQWSGEGGFRVKGKVGSIFVMTVPFAKVAVSCGESPVGCTEGTSPSGRQMMTFDGGKGSSRLVRVAIAAPGGRVIIMHHIPEPSGPVLTVAQFLQIFDSVAAQLK